MIMEDSRYNFDVYRVTLSEQIGHHEFSIVDVIKWNTLKIRMTDDELRGLTDFINEYLERINNEI